LEKIITTSNAEGRQWLSGLMKDVDKWTRAHDKGGWRYEFQCSNMVESFNKLLFGIRAMHVNAIVIFSFYKLNEFSMTDMKRHWSCRVLDIDGVGRPQIISLKH
jgi:hypothetical protein